LPELCFQPRETTRIRCCKNTRSRHSGRKPFASCKALRRKNDES
jgi:hypothetical protein